MHSSHASCSAQARAPESLLFALCSMETAQKGDLGEIVANHHVLLDEARLIRVFLCDAQPLKQVAEVSCKESSDILHALGGGSRVVAQAVLLEKLRPAKSVNGWLSFCALPMLKPEPATRPGSLLPKLRHLRERVNDTQRAVRDVHKITMTHLQTARMLAVCQCRVWFSTRRSQEAIGHSDGCKDEWDEQ